MNSEEAFVLASLKEFVKLWGSSSEASFHLECSNGQAWFRLGSRLGSPASPHFIPAHPQSSVPQQSQQRRRKGPSRRLKDSARAAAHRARRDHQLIVTTADEADFLAPEPAVSALPPPSPTGSSSGSIPAASAGSSSAPPPPAPSGSSPESSLGAPAGLSPAPPSAVTAAGSEPFLPPPGPAAPAGPSLQPPGPAPVLTVSPPPLREERHDNRETIVNVHATAVIESSPHDKLEHKSAIEKLIFSEHHMRSNVIAVNMEHVSTRSFRSKLFTHTVNVMLSVKTSALWDSPRQYIWKHLGQNEWTKNDGTRIKFTRIHVK